MSGRVDDLLAAPLGRQVVYAALGFSTFDLYRMVGLGMPPGAAMLTASGTTGGAPPPVRRGLTDVRAAGARQAIQEMVSASRWRRLADASELEVLSWIAGETGSFGFRGEDEWLWDLTAAAADEMAPVAELLLSCPAAANWWRPLVRDDQRVMAFDWAEAFLGHDLRGLITEAAARHKADNAARATSRRYEKKRRRDEAAGIRYGAQWWSTPTLRLRAVSVGPFEGIPSIELLDFVDPGSLTGLATVISFATDHRAVVYEVNGPRDWAALVERYPMDATGTHDGEWRYWGGVPGPWVLPDWDRVADDYAGIHVTVGGYLTSCGTAMRVGDSYTMLTGWVPDGTLWLSDTSTQFAELGTWDFSRAGGHRPHDDDDPHEGWTPR